MPVDRREGNDNDLPSGWQRLPRLLTLTTLVQRDITIAEAVRALRLSTGANLSAEGNEVLPSHMTLYYRSVPLADVLRGIAAARNLIWEKKPQGELVLHQRHTAQDLQLFHPHTEAEARMWSKGRELLKQLAAQPQDVQDTMQRTTTAGGPLVPDGIAFADLPPALQQTTRDMFAASLENNAEAGHPSYLGSSDLGNARIRLTINRQESLTHYGFTISSDAAGASMWTTIFRDPKESYSVVPMDAVSSRPLPTYPEDAATQQQAQADAACLKTRVHLTTGTYTLPEALFALAAQAHFHFALPLDSGSETRKFRCDDEPLGDVLPRLCRTFVFTTPATGRRWEWNWNWRKDNFFIFHYKLLADKPRTTGKLDTTFNSSTPTRDKQAGSP